MKTNPVIVISVMVLAAATGVAAACLHFFRPPSPPSPITVLVGTITNTNKDPL